MKSEKPKTKKRFSRPVKFLFWLAGAVILYTVVGFLVVPAVIKSQMLKRLPVMLGRPVAVAQVQVNPYLLSLTIRGLAVNETNGAPFAGFDEFFAQLKFSSFFQHGWAVKEIYLTHPFAGLIRAKDGKLNFDDIVAALNQPGSSPSTNADKASIPLVVIGSLHIDNANIAIEDFVPSTPVKTKILPIHLRLDNLSTDPKSHNPWTFTAQTDAGETIKWEGIFSLDPVEVTGTIELKNLNLKKYSPYLARFADADVVDGRVDATTHYTATLGTNGQEDVTLDKTDVAVRSLAVKSTAPDETILSIGAVSLKLTEASLHNQIIHLAYFKTDTGSLLVRQNPDRTINLLKLLKLPTNSAPAPVAPPASNGLPWTVIVDEIAVDHYNIALEDQAPARPAKFNVKDIAFHSTNFSTASNAPLALEVGMNLNEAGKVAVQGTVRLQPPSADLVVDVAGLDLRPLQPYLEQQVKLSLGGGQFTLRGHAVYNPQASPQAAFDGDFGLTNFATTDLIEYKDFVKFDGLAVTGIKATYQPMQLGIQEIGLSGLSTTIIMQTNHQINLLAVLPSKPTAAAPTAPPPVASSGVDFPVTLASLMLDKASIHFSDQSIEPNCLFDVQEFGGSIKGLSSAQDARAAVDIHGKVDDVSSFSVSGDVNPLSKDLIINLAIDCKNVNLTPFTPYMEKYGGYPLQRGKLLVDLHHNIAGGMLMASNHITLAGFTLGSRNTSTNAVKLPLKFGIALLKDRFGNIDLDVPLSGRLNDPDFKVWPIVWQVVGNLLGRAATAPFTFLGKIFGGGEEMSYVDFQPGLSAVPSPEQSKLDKVAKILYERPGLQLEISATSDPATDIPVLTRLKLDDQIRALQAKELIAAGTPPETVQTMKVEPTNYARLLKAFYYETVGTNTATNSTNTTTDNTTTSPIPTVAGATNVPVAVPAFTNRAPLGTSSILAITSLQRPLFIKGGEIMVLDNSPRNVGQDIVYTFPPAAKTPISAATSPTPRVMSTNKIAVNTAGITNSLGTTNIVDIPPPPPEPTQAEMEAALLATIQINVDDLRALMQARARSVQAALIQSGKVEGERLFILAPAPVSLAAKGQSRANLAFPQ